MKVQWNMTLNVNAFFLMQTNSDLKSENKVKDDSQRQKKTAAVVSIIGYVVLISCDYL